MLLARKRPRLRPIYDSVVVPFTGIRDQHWEPMRQVMCATDADLHHRPLRLREAAGLSPHVSALRIFDVIGMESKRRDLAAPAALPGAAGTDPARFAVELFRGRRTPSVSRTGCSRRPRWSIW